MEITIYSVGKYRSETKQREINMTILVLGGYGGTGRVFCRYFLKETGVQVIVAGRRLDQAEELARTLGKEFSPERVSARFADASDVESLRKAFHNIDLVLVAATTTQWARQIAETAIESGIDYLDIYFQQDVYAVLEQLNQRIISRLHSLLPRYFRNS
jgi:saccharopine dehydrogenase-like NADP-dependent oxidoreductase